MSRADFVLAVDKPEGPTSHDVVARARKALDTKRVGHTGTLDPLASGLLVLCVGKATRLAEYLTGMDKSYLAEVRLGVETDTLDGEGRVVARSEAWTELSAEDVGSALESLTGEIGQVPPQYSAKKVDGEAMHRKARRGETATLAPVRVTVHSVELTAWSPPSVALVVRCSSGTYIRALARDLGRRLGVGAHLSGLRRTGVGPFDVADALSVDELGDPAAVSRARLGPLEALADFHRVDVDADVARRVGHGQRIRLTPPDDSAGGPGASQRDLVAVADDGELVAVAHDGDLVAVARLTDGVLKPVKVFPA